MKKNHHIPFLQLLRALAALAVMIYHRKARLVITGVQRGEKLFGSAPLAVDLFFIMSGFVLSLSLTRMDFSKRRYAIKIFCIERVSRILPMWWTAILGRAILLEPRHRFTRRERRKDTLKSLFFIPLNFEAAAPYYGYSKLLIGRTMHYEILIYLLIALGIFFVKRYTILLVTGLLIIVFLVTHSGDLTSFTILKGLLNPYTHSFAVGSIWNFLSNPLFLEFATGVLLALLYTSSIQFPKILSRLCIISGITSLFLQINELRQGGHGLAQWGYGCLLLMMGGVMLHKSKPFDIHPSIERIAKISYSIYLTHLIIQECFSHYLVPLFPMVSGPLRLALSSVTILGVSYYSWYYIEQQFGKWLKTKLNLIFG